MINERLNLIKVIKEKLFCGLSFIKIHLFEQSTKKKNTKKSLLINLAEVYFDIDIKFLVKKWKIIIKKIFFSSSNKN